MNRVNKQAPGTRQINYVYVCPCCSIKYKLEHNCRFTPDVTLVKGVMNIKGTAVQVEPEAAEKIMKLGLLNRRIEKKKYRAAKKKAAAENEEETKRWERSQVEVFKARIDEIEEEIKELQTKWC